MRDASVVELHLREVFPGVQLPILRRSLDRLDSISVPLLPSSQPAATPYLNDTWGCGNQGRGGAPGGPQPTAMLPAFLQRLMPVSRHLWHSVEHRLTEWDHT